MGNQVAWAMKKMPSVGSRQYPNTEDILYNLRAIQEIFESVKSDDVTRTVYWAERLITMVDANVDEVRVDETNRT